MSNASTGTRYHFRYFDHDADVGITGSGATLEESYESAAAATFALMTELPSVQCRRTVKITFEEADVELALVQWINALLAAAREQGLVFSMFALERDGVVWRGAASGEAWRPGMERGTEVKGATLTMLSVRQTAEGWEARCVVDV
ncbi:MAG TPA: archease [Burkholderiales bacterium]|nr:archease [Burkholderiales bacterium]